MSKKRKYIIIIGIIIILIFSGVIFNKWSVEHKKAVLSRNVEEKVSRISELSTIKYNYTNIVSYKDNIKLKGIDIPLTNKSFILKYSGYLKAGLDLTTLEMDIIDRSSIYITIDKAKVLENIIMEEDVTFFDEKDNIFNKLSFKDLYEVLINEKENAKEEAIQKGLLNEAEINAEEIIKVLLGEMGFKNINIKFK